MPMISWETYVFPDWEAGRRFMRKRTGHCYGLGVGGICRQCGCLYTLQDSKVRRSMEFGICHQLGGVYLETYAPIALLIMTTITTARQTQSRIETGYTYSIGKKVAVKIIRCWHFLKRKLINTSSHPKTHPSIHPSMHPSQNYISYRAGKEL